jgi:uncharacterized sporulation protein YeaH/YhbH (DUF444 family)
MGKIIKNIILVLIAFLIISGIIAAFTDNSNVKVVPLSDITALINDNKVESIEVDQDTFFKTRESGGTLISSAYKLCEKIIETDYSPSEWNIYPFHFSDGDNWSGEDTKLCLDLLQQSLLPKVNVFCYGQVESRYGSGQFYKDLAEHYGTDHESVILSRIESKEAILQSIREFLGKGK